MYSEKSIASSNVSLQRWVDLLSWRHSQHNLWGTLRKPISASAVTCEIDVSVVNFLST